MADPRPGGASYVVTSRRPVILGKPPSPRGIFSLSPLRTPALWSTPATAGPAWLATPPLTGAPRRGAQPRGEGVHRVWRRVRSEGVALIVSPLGRGYMILKDNFLSILTIAPSELARRKSLAREQTMPNRKDPKKGQHRRNAKRRESR